MGEGKRGQREENSRMPFAEDTGGGFRLVRPMKDMGIDITIRNLVRGWNVFTILRFTFVDPELGTAKPIPYAYGSVKLDGADTVLTHYIEYSDESKVRVGGRVEAIFEEKRTGGIRDIKHFRLIE